MVTILLRKFADCVLSTLPVFIVVLVLHFTNICPLDGNQLLLFCISTLFLIIGMWLFSIGTEQAMTPMGEYVGTSLTKKKSIYFIIIITFLLGVFVTIAEPDLQVLAAQVPINSWLLIISIGIGVGVFFVIGVIRIIFQQSLNMWLLATYALVFAIACLVDPSLLPVSFDGGGVSTGPVTVPFILALGSSIAISRDGKKSNADAFGLAALCSIGPIIAVMILSLFMDKTGLVYKQIDYDTSSNIFSILGVGFLNALIDVSIAILPITVFFFVYQIIFIKLSSKMIMKIIVGLLYTYVGLILFIMAVNAGFAPISQIIGKTISSDPNNLWLVVLIGTLIGFFAVLAEPAVQVLVRQVVVLSDGTIKKSTMLLALCIGVGASSAFCMLRIIYDIPFVYFIVPGYVIAFALSFVVPKIYTAIAFDSGGVASGPMTTAFILPFAIGVATTLGTNILSSAFGVVSIVAMTPLVTIQLLGLYAQIQSRIRLNIARGRIKEENDDQIIHFC